MLYISEPSSSRTSNSLILIRAAATLAAVTSYTTTAQQSPPTRCSCSPTKFTFQLNYDGTCGSTSLTGITNELCFVNVRESLPEPESDEVVANILSDMSAMKERREKDDFWRRLSHQEGTNNNIQSQRALNSQVPTIITTVQIFEYDTTSELNVLKQEEITNSDQDLSNGQTFEFTSISSDLDPNIPLEDQVDYFPNGLIVKISGKNANNEYVSNTFAWEYDIEDCTTEQIAVGDYIGWTTVTETTSAYRAFCPAVSTLAPTESPVVSPTSSPVLIPTNSPTNSPVSSPVSSTTNSLVSSPSNDLVSSLTVGSKSAKVPKAKAPKAAYSYTYDWSYDEWRYTDSHSKPTTTPVYNSPTW